MAVVVPARETCDDTLVYSPMSHITADSSILLFGLRSGTGQMSTSENFASHTRLPLLQEVQTSVASRGPAKR